MILFYIVFWILVSAFFSGVETGFYSLNRVRLKLNSNSSKKCKNVFRVSKLVEDKQAFICFILIGNNIANYMLAAITTSYFETLNSSINGEIWATAIITPLIFIFGETVPKNIFRNQADYLMYRLSFLIQFIKNVFSPFIYILKLLVYSFFFFIKNEESKEAEYFDRFQIQHAILNGAQDGVISPYQNKITKNILRLGEMPISQVMEPMEKVFMLPSSFTKNDVISKTQSSGFSRFPIYNPDTSKIEGIACFYDIFYLENSSKVFIHKPVFIKDSDNIFTVLTNLAKTRQQMAIILNSEERYVGIVTLKSLARYIVVES